MKRILVTGCWGFVGRFVVELLQSRGYEVWGTDIRDSQKDFPGKECVIGDLLDERTVTLLLDVADPDAIIHLAGQSSARLSFDEPHRTIRSNILPCLYILDLLRTRSLRTRLLAVGSAEEYGPLDAGAMPIKEDCPTHPVSPYALSKAMQNECCRSYHSLYNVDVIITRSFNHTGPGQTDTFVLGSIARQIAEIEEGLREPVIEIGNLEVRRDFLDVRDVGEAYLSLLEKGKSGEVYNVCSGKAYNLHELLDQLCRFASMDVELRVTKDRLRPVDTPELRGDPGKIHGDTGWAPRIPIEKTLQALLDHWRESIRGIKGGKIG